MLFITNSSGACKMSISNYITNCLIKENVIKESEREVYSYCLNGLLEYLFFSISIIFLSFLTDHFFAGILFLSMLFFIKSFTGGIHAGNPVLCYISSCLLFILLNMLAMFFSVFSRPELGSIAFLISITIKPVPCPNKKVSPKLLFRSRLISGINGLIFLLISVLLYINGIDYESSIINLTYLGIAILQVAGKIVYHTGGI